MSSNQVLASSPGECCLKTVQHTGTAVGSWENIGSFNTYKSLPPHKTTYDRILLFFCDVFGPEYINNQLLIDYFASNGYLVVAPDCFEGKAIFKVDRGPDFDLFKWIQPYRERATKLLPSWIDAIKSKYGHENTKYVTVGYCFGGPDVVNLTATDWLAAGAFVHPAFLTEDQFRNVKQPLFLSCAEIDQTFPSASRHRAEVILAEIKANYHVQVFARVEHGFGIRGDPNIPEQKWAKEESARSILGWFDRFCS
ncbi:alpha/beta-hydrolase [Dentipellis sp. KUC8613]|nr:alpha/beta-hydrolase [Dentipellis sp. KUC8613]